MLSGPAVSEGSLSDVEGGPEVTVTILRDTRAAQSLLLAGVLELPESSSLNTSVLVEGVGREYGLVPLHNMFLRYNMVTGPVTVGVMPSLPVKSVTFVCVTYVCVSPC